MAGSPDWWPHPHIYFCFWLRQCRKNCRGDQDDPAHFCDFATVFVGVPQKSESYQQYHVAPSFLLGLQGRTRLQNKRDNKQTHDAGTDSLWSLLLESKPNSQQYCSDQKDHEHSNTSFQVVAGSFPARSLRCDCRDQRQNCQTPANHSDGVEPVSVAIHDHAQTDKKVQDHVNSFSRPMCCGNRQTGQSR